jgi:hypothetical protein
MLTPDAIVSLLGIGGLVLILCIHVYMTKDA